MQKNNKVPVVHKDGTALMPCSPSKARKLIKSGGAIKKWTKTGVFYIQLTTETGKKTQQMAMGIDPGAKYDGYAIATKEQMQLTGMLTVKNTIKKKLKNRRQMRRKRRFKLRRRPKRFNNRTRREGWLPPSMEAKSDMRIALIKNLLSIYPISDFVVEDMKIDGNKLKGRMGKQFFTWTMVSKGRLYSFLKNHGVLHLEDASETKAVRQDLSLKKTKKKGELVFTSQAVDGFALCWLLLGTKNMNVPIFYAWKRPELKRRQLHRFEPLKGGVRNRYGGTTALGVKKNTVVEYKGELYRTGGTTEGRLSLHSFDYQNKRVTQNAKLENCRLLFHQTWFSQVS